MKLSRSYPLEMNTCSTVGVYISPQIRILHTKRFFAHQLNGKPKKSLRSLNLKKNHYRRLQFIPSILTSNNSRERVSVRENEVSTSRERIAIRENGWSYSRERIAIRENRLSKSSERITNLKTDCTIRYND